MESTSYQTYLNKKKHHKVDKYFLKQKRRNGTEPIENRTYATYARVSNGKRRTPRMRSLWCPPNSETYYN